MTSSGNLLELACSRIADLDTPAYVENSELRYVAVNEAYAASSAGKFQFDGHRSPRNSRSSGREEREDKERRALVFGAETAICFDAAATEHERIQ